MVIIIFIINGPRGGEDDDRCGVSSLTGSSGQPASLIQATGQAGSDRLQAHPAGDLAVNAGPVELRDNGGLEIGPGRRLPLVGDDGNLVPSRQLGQESARIQRCYTFPAFFFSLQSIAQCSLPPPPKASWIEHGAVFSWN